MSKFSSIYYFSDLKKFPRRIDNCPFATTWVKLTRLMFLEITNLDRFILASKKLANFFQELPSHKKSRKFKEPDILEFATILHQTFSEASQSLRFWFLYKIGSCLDMFNRHTLKLQKRYELYKNNPKVIFYDITPY